MFFNRYYYTAYGHSPAKKLLTMRSEQALLETFGGVEFSFEYC